MPRQRKRPAWAITSKGVTRWRKKRGLKTKHGHVQVVYLDGDYPLGGCWEKPLLINEDQGLVFGTFWLFGECVAAAYYPVLEAFVVTVPLEFVAATLGAIHIFSGVERDVVQERFAKGEEKLKWQAEPRTPESDLRTQDERLYGLSEDSAYLRTLFSKGGKQAAAKPRLSAAKNSRRLKLTRGKRIAPGRTG